MRPEADPENRHTAVKGGLQGIVETSPAQGVHAAFGRPDARENDPIGLRDYICVRHQLCLRANFPTGALHAAEISCTIIYNCDH